MLERANTATREVLARSVRGVGRLGANSLKERYQSPELSRDHTPTRSLGGAETGRSAMNGNDGPFCLCCMQAGLRAPENAAAHSKQCKLPVHSRGWCAIWCGCQKKAGTPGKPSLAALASGVRSEGALPLRQRVDSPVEPPGQGGA